MVEWVDLESVGFPGYELSNEGEVKNIRTRHSLVVTPNQGGVVRVGLMKRDEGKQITISLVRLVARMFVPGKSVTFNTPIQLDGDRNNCRADNIRWRPRHFAVKYYNQFEENLDPLYRNTIVDVETSKRYANSRTAAKENGLLEEAILKSVVNGSPCFPTWQIFAHVKN